MKLNYSEDGKSWELEVSQEEFENRIMCRKCGSRDNLHLCEETGYLFCNKCELDCSYTHNLCKYYKKDHFHIKLTNIIIDEHKGDHSEQQKVIPILA